LLFWCPCFCQQGTDTTLVARDTVLTSREDKGNSPKILTPLPLADQQPVMEKKYDSVLTRFRTMRIFGMPMRNRRRKKDRRINLFIRLVWQQWFLANLFWFIIIAGFAGVIIWFLVSSNVRLFKIFGVSKNGAEDVKKIFLKLIMNSEIEKRQ